MPEIVEACSRASLQIGGPTLRRLGITSSIRGEGRSTVAVAMAAVQRADYGRAPLLLELDFDRPSLARRLGIRLCPGLAELIRGEAPIDEVVQPIAAGLTVITAGAARGAASRLIVDLLRTDQLEVIGREFDVIVADFPPLLGSGFSRVAATGFERMVVVVRAGVTPIARVREATAGLLAQPVVILNGTHNQLPRWIRKLTGS
jgi:Mrp family chromosome partitioning ATPase